MTVRALDGWRRLEEAAGEELLVTTGGVYAGEWADRCADGLAACGVDHDWLPAAEAAERFPDLAFDGLERVLWQEDGGVCRAGPAVAGAGARRARAGRRPREGAEVTRLAAHDDHAELETASGDVLQASAVVVAAGAWAGPLLQQVGIELPLSPVFAQVSVLRLGRCGLSDAAPELHRGFGPRVARARRRRLLDPERRRPARDPGG